MKNGADIRICKEVYDFPLNYGLSIVDVSVDSIAIKYVYFTKCCFVTSGNKLTYRRGSG